MVKAEAGSQKFKQILDQKQFEPTVEVQFSHMPYEPWVKSIILFYCGLDILFKKSCRDWIDAQLYCAVNSNKLNHIRPKEHY